VKEISQKNAIELEAEHVRMAGARRKILKLIGLLLITGVLGVGLAYWIGWPQYLLWQQRRSLAQASGYEQQGDMRRALLLLEQAYQLYPKNLEARRRLAAFWERIGQRQALAEWKEITRIDPADPQNHLGLAAAALRFGEIGTLRAALGHLKQAGQTGADYFRMAAGLALIDRDNVALEAALVELARLQPDDPKVRLNLALARLSSADPERAQTGRAALIELARVDRVRIRVVVELLNDMARRFPRPSRERREAFAGLAHTLTPPRGPRNEPTELNDPVERLLAYAMRQPAPEAEDAGQLLSWMILNGRAAAAFEWRETLPVEVRTDRLVEAPAAEAALQTSDWPHLRTLLLDEAWGPVPPAVVNGAFAARENHSRWAPALESARSSLPALRALLRLATAWDWADEQRQVLTAITRDFAAEHWAWRRLLALALEHHDAGELWATYQRWSRAAPGNLGVQVEAAIVGLLLEERGAPGLESTAALLQQQPANPGAAVAHALALRRARRGPEALPALDALPPATWNEPRYALTYGLLLAEAGRAKESEAILARAAAESLLPAELLLVEQARARNRPRLAPPGGR